MPSKKQYSSSDEEFDDKVETKEVKHEEPSKKKSKPSSSSSNTVFELGDRRRITVGEYMGKKLINIREFYLDKATGEEKPGSKGIALSVEQWNNLLKQANDINEAVKTM